MFFIIKTVIDDKGQFVSSKNVAHEKTVSKALALLEKTVRDYIEKECGKPTSDAVKIIDIHNFSQVSEPIVDTMLIYRLVTDPHYLHVYQRKTSIVPGRIYGETTVTYFRKVQIFYLDEYNGINVLDSTNVGGIEMVPLGPAKVSIPKQMTVAPMCNVLKQLKDSAKFKNRFEMTGSPTNNSFLLRQGPVLMASSPTNSFLNKASSPTNSFLNKQENGIPIQKTV